MGVIVVVFKVFLLILSGDVNNICNIIKCEKFEKDVILQVFLEEWFEDVVEEILKDEKEGCVKVFVVLDDDFIGIQIVYGVLVFMEW